ASELDLSFDRNPSLEFTKFYHQVWPMVRSLTETIHYLPKIVDLMLITMLTPNILNITTTITKFTVVHNNVSTKANTKNNKHIDIYMINITYNISKQHKLLQFYTINHAIL